MVIHGITWMYMFQSGFAIQCKCDVGCSSGENDKVHQHTTDQNTSERFQNIMSRTCLCDKFVSVDLPLFDLRFLI